MLGLTAVECLYALLKLAATSRTRIDITGASHCCSGEALKSWSRISPQCLHLIASGFVVWAQYGHIFVLIASLIENYNSTKVYMSSFRLLLFSINIYSSFQIANYLGTTLQEILKLLMVRRGMSILNLTT